MPDSAEYKIVFKHFTSPDGAPGGEAFVALLEKILIASNGGANGRRKISRIANIIQKIKESTDGSANLSFEEYSFTQDAIDSVSCDCTGYAALSQIYEIFQMS